MTKLQKISLFALRVSMGWMMFYAGITKVLNPEWTAAGYIGGAKNFIGFFNLFLQPNILPIVNLANEWGLTLIGVALILGIFVRWASLAGIALMILYYLVILDFPHPNPQSYIVDQHVIYITALLAITAFKAGKAWGLENKFN